VIWDFSFAREAEVAEGRGDRLRLIFWIFTWWAELMERRRMGVRTGCGVEGGLAEMLVVGRAECHKSRFF